MKKNILMSLRFEPFDLIRKGEKKFEYRTRFPNQPIDAWIYVSRQVKAICGKIQFDMPIVGTAKEMGDFIVNLSGDENRRKAMEEYCLKANKGYAIPVKKVCEISPISLKTIRNKFPEFYPPQSYYYLDNKEYLLEYLEKQKIIKEKILIKD